jgi:hypothetical protein
MKMGRRYGEFVIVPVFSGFHSRNAFPHMLCAKSRLAQPFLADPVIDILYYRSL